MFNKSILTALALSILSAGSLVQAKEPPPAQLGISPPRLEMTLEGAIKNESLTIHNYSDKPKTIDLELLNVSTIPGGKTIAPGPQSLSRWTLFNPRRFTVEPGQAQTVRMSIRPRTSLEPGTRYGILSIRQDMGDRAKLAGSENGAMKVSIGSSYGLPVIVKIP